MMKLALCSIGLFTTFSTIADLKPLADAEMSQTSGAGLGFALEDFMFDTEDATLSITGIEDGAGNEVGITWDQFYVMGNGSQNGSNPTSTNIGSYLNPWVIRTARGSSDWDGPESEYYTGDAPAIGDDVALLQIMTDVYESSAQDTRQYVLDCVIGSASDCGDRALIRRDGADIGSRFTLDFINGTQHIWDLDISGVYLDGSSLWLWSRKDVNGQSELLGQLNLSMFAEQVQMQTCAGNCSTDSVLTIDGLYLGLNLGFGDVQPLKFSATSDGNFVLELSKPLPESQGVDVNDSEAMLAFYNNYYDNAPMSNVYVGEMKVGDRTAGEIIVNGFRAQYLKATSRDL